MAGDHEHDGELGICAGREIAAAQGPGIFSSGADAGVDDTASASSPTGVAGRIAIPRFNWEIVDFAEHFPSSTPNGVLAILRVNKGWRARADAEMFRLRSGGRRDAVLKDEAQRFDRWLAGETPR